MIRFKAIMRTRKLALVLGPVAAVVAWFISPSLTAQQPRRVDEPMIRNAGKTGEEWLTYNLTPGETRYSPLKQIDTTNVGKLAMAWSYEIHDRRRRNAGIDAAGA